jgi:hypothetical protein
MFLMDSLGAGSAAVPRLSEEAPTLPLAAGTDQDQEGEDPGAVYRQGLHPCPFRLCTFRKAGM